MEDWGALRAQLIDTAKILAGKPGLAIQAVVQRLDELETRVECVHCGFVWTKGEEPRGHECSMNPLVVARDSLRGEVVALRQRVEECERAPRCCADTIPPGCRTCRCADAAAAKLARCVEALEGLLNAWDRAEGGRGCYSCAELHDCRCELDRKISTVCTCGRVELDAAAETARAALAAAKGGE